VGRTFASHRYDFNDDTGVLVLDICSALLAHSGAPVMRQEQPDCYRSARDNSGRRSPAEARTSP
jgi:hypothetical protein